MSRRPPELFARDLKYLVSATPPHQKRRSGSHSHWLATALIAILVGVWLGGDPSASIDIQTARGTVDTTPSHSLSVFEDPMSISDLDFDERSAPEDLVDLWPTNRLEDDFHGNSVMPAAIGGLEFGPHQPVREANWTTDIHFDDFSFDLEQIHTGFDDLSAPLELVPPSLEMATGFEEHQSDIESFVVDTRFNLTAMDNPAGSGWNVIDIKKGDTLSGIFKRLGIDPEVTHRLTTTELGKLLNSLSTGPNLKIRLSQEGRLEAVRYNVDAVRILVADLSGDDIITDIEHRTISVREREVTGHIRSTLFQAGAKVGLSDQFVLRLAAIFKWNIDFNTDLQPGDRFSVIFEEKYIDDRKIATGGIIAAAFRVGGRTHTAVRHVETDGSVSYFSADGQSLKSAFLRSPVKFTRISSQFSPSRYHPVLKKWRAHKGVDYAAARGTPVLATADGEITLRGTKGGYGNVVILQHGKNYSTLYAHLDGFAKNLRAGSKVKQGQVIGYVGSSGLATGPHLHYEFRVNGEHKDPLTVDVPRTLPIAGKEREEFMRVAANFERKLGALLN